MNLQRREWKKEKETTFGSKIATALWAPNATNSQAPHETLFTILLHPAPMNTRFTPTSLPPPPTLTLDMVEESQRKTTVAVTLVFSRGRLQTQFCWFRKRKEESVFGLSVANGPWTFIRFIILYLPKINDKKKKYQSNDSNYRNVVDMVNEKLIYVVNYSNAR